MPARTTAYNHDKEEPDSEQATPSHLNKDLASPRGLNFTPCFYHHHGYSAHLSKLGRAMRMTCCRLGRENARGRGSAATDVMLKSEFCFSLALCCCRQTVMLESGASCAALEELHALRRAIEAEED